LPPISYRDAAWETLNPALTDFDLIIGSDLLYEPNHPQLLAGFLERHAKAATRIMIADAGRGYRGQFSKRMAMLGYGRTEMPCRAGGPEIERKGRILHFTRPA
jgi:predicted nicotinamide N-methyase